MAPTTDPGEREPPAVLPTPKEPPDGPCFLLIKKDNGDFSKSNPFALKRALDTLCGPLNSAKTTNTGTLLVETTDKTQSMNILRSKTLGGLPITVSLASRMRITMGCVRSDAITSLTNEELLQELQSQGVCRVERLRSRNAAEWGPNPTVKLGFYGDALPYHITCGYLRVPVNPWIPAPTLCSHCWEVGSHTARSCRRRSPKCGRCGRSNHVAGDCQAETPSCPSCRQAHPAWDSNCPVRVDARDWHRAVQKERRDAHRAASRQAPPVQWPLNPAEWPLPSEALPRAAESRSTAKRDPRTPERDNGTGARPGMELALPSWVSETPAPLAAALSAPLTTDSPASPAAVPSDCETPASALSAPTASETPLSPAADPSARTELPPTPAPQVAEADETPDREENDSLSEASTEASPVLDRTIVPSTPETEHYSESDLSTATSSPASPNIRHPVGPPLPRPQSGAPHPSAASGTSDTDEWPESAPEWWKTSPASHNRSQSRSSSTDRRLTRSAVRSLNL